ncbi:MAG: glutathione S-transferase family protein [Rhodospirillaceae bacterium]|nr:glutathione S-transferase family protein [Rhodospirillaceae bacterium]
MLQTKALNANTVPAGATIRSANIRQLPFYASANHSQLHNGAVGGASIANQNELHFKDTRRWAGPRHGPALRPRLRKVGVAAMSLRFYFAPMSTASVTAAVIGELGVACERIEVSIAKGDTRTAGFLALNPNGRVPVIVHNGTVIWESAAITLYLGETFGVARGLYPPPGPRRGEAMKWIVWSSVTLAEAAGRLSAALPAGTAGAVEDGSRDAAARYPGGEVAARVDVMACLAIVDAALRDRPYLLGDYTLADTHLFMLVGWIMSMGIAADSFPNLGGWIARCGTRPVFAMGSE